MSWASDFPEELLCRPMGLVVLTGLDITYNAVHKSIWDSFCNNRRQDRVPLKFRVFEADHEYPKGRSKRTSYEWYIPKGILKTSWMHKHLERMPAVVVVFYDLDWDEHMWKEKQMECATRVEIVRSTLVGRGTKVAVVLIQKNTPLPPGEDVIAAERAASLCSACELSAKSLFVLPHSDHLLGYTIRLENAFYELSQSYYYAEARRVKSHKEFLNKTTHQLLYVRHQFKIGFLNELKQDTHIALKHYKQAYGHALDLRMHDTNMLEVKTIACFINYKICRLSFQHNVPLDAIAQFRKHIDFFKSKIGSPELAFEHSAWMSKQFQVFGDLFDEAIKLGLTAVQTQHPGFYYQQAANHAIARKQLCRGLCHALAAPPVPDPLENLTNLDFYGQRPWRQGHQSIDPPDSVKEREGIRALQALELTVDHSWLIIPLLSSAVSQFKKYKSPRMKRYLMVQMGEEYYHAKDYNKGLTILSRVTWDYRQERWWPLLTSILITSLRCAYLVGNVDEYVTICLELMGKNILCSPEEKTRIQMNLIRVMSNDAPEPEPGCDSDCVEKAKSLWKTDPSTRESNVFTVEMNNIIPFIECKARFTHATFKADEPVELDVFLRTSCPFPIRFSKLSVLINNVAYNEFCSVTDTEGISSTDEGSGYLYLVPGKPKRQTFTFIPLKEDVGKQIQITSVALEVGSENARCAILHWSSEAISSQLPPHGVNASQHVSDVDSLPWDKIHTSPTTSIIPRESQLEISLEHSLPSLVNEFYFIEFSIDNKEENEITDISLSVGLTEGQDQIMEQTTHICVDQAEYDGKVVSKRMGINLGSLQPGEQISRNLFVKCLQVGDRLISAKVMYNVIVVVNEQQITCMCNKEEKWKLPVVTPFEVSVNLNSLKFETIEAIHGDEPFLLLSELICTSPWPLEIKSSDLKLSPYVQSCDGNLQSQVEGLNLQKDERATECHCLVAPPSIQPSVPLGMYTINWRRKEHNNVLPYVSTTLTLPTIPVEHVPLFVDAELPSHGSVRVCLPAVYTIYNRTSYVQEMEVNMENSECFMFSGHKHVHVRILPSSNHQLSFNLFPLMTGFIELPKLQVNMLRYPGVFNDVVQKMLPTHIFIKPSGKEMQPTLV
ncbi:trafficking protein particle complex subunit 11-like isoform X2 [Lineus longissimus]|uniref:trafficking protein particle complex subunit 11-like isoform X2 n=1 Tax=Lineus longissimus TaxID=88925 RepID=UPI002B4CAA43